MKPSEVVDALKQGLSNVNSEGYGYDPKHVENPFHATIESYGCFKYSHSFVLDAPGLPVIEHVYRCQSKGGDMYSVHVQDFKSVRSMKTHYFRYELTGPSNIDYKWSDYFYRGADGSYYDADDIGVLRFLLDTHAFKASRLY